jgi:hypothetical protein
VSLPDSIATPKGYVNKGLAFAYVVDRFGNKPVATLVELPNIDSKAPSVSASGNEITFTENGGSGFKELKFYQYAHSGGTSFLEEYMEEVEKRTVLTPGQATLNLTFTGIVDGSNRIVAYAKDNAGNPVQMTVTVTPENGTRSANLTIRVVDAFNTAPAQLSEPAAQAFGTQALTLAENGAYNVELNGGAQQQLFVLPEGIAAVAEPVFNGDRMRLRVLTSLEVEALSVKDLSTGSATTYRPGSTGVTVAEDAEGNALFWTIETAALYGDLLISAKIAGEWVEAPAMLPASELPPGGSGSGDDGGMGGQSGDAEATGTDPTETETGTGDAAPVTDDPALPPVTPPTEPADVEPTAPTAEEPAPAADASENEAPQQGAQVPQETAAPAAASAQSTFKSLLEKLLKLLKSLFGVWG